MPAFTDQKVMLHHKTVQNTVNHVNYFHTKMNVLHSGVPDSPRSSCLTRWRWSWGWCTCPTWTTPLWPVSRRWSRHCTLPGPASLPGLWGIGTRWGCSGFLASWHAARLASASWVPVLVCQSVPHLAKEMSIEFTGVGERKKVRHIK